MAGEKYVVGIDEAGRGPLVGPMVVAGIAVEAGRIREIVEAGVRDSKELSGEQRRRLLREIEEKACCIIVVHVPPSLIDSVNLNRLEENTFAYIAQRMHTLLGEKLAEVEADAVGPPERLAKVLRRVLPEHVRVVVRARADRYYPAVSAASIVAKVVRDREIERLRRNYGVAGSGYPTDPRTLSWLRRAYMENPETPPSFIRRTWGTLRSIAPKWYLEKKTATREKEEAKRTLLDFLAKQSRQQSSKA